MHIVGLIQGKTSSFLKVRVCIFDFSEDSVMSTVYGIELRSLFLPFRHSFASTSGFLWIFKSMFAIHLREEFFLHGMSNKLLFIFYHGADQWTNLLPHCARDTVFFLRWSIVWLDLFPIQFHYRILSVFVCDVFQSILRNLYGSSLLEYMDTISKEMFSAYEVHVNHFCRDKHN